MYGLTMTATGMAPKSQRTSKNIPSLPNTEFMETKQLSAFMVRNVCNGDVPDLEACQKQRQPEDG